MGCFVRGGKNGMGCYVRGDKNSMGCYVQGDKNCMGCFVRGGKSLWDVLSGVSKMTWDVLSRDVLSGSLRISIISLCLLLGNSILPISSIPMVNQKNFARDEYWIVPKSKGEFIK